MNLFCLQRPIASLRAAIVMMVVISTSLLAESADPFVMVVMDPLSKPLACDCVQGYAQRDYMLLASHLESSLGRPVKTLWFESLENAMDQSGGKADLVIGKHSVILADAKSMHYELLPVARLTGKDGSTTQTGLIVVRGEDPAQELRDLQGYRILFGPEEAEEKSSAPEAAFRAAGISLPQKCERFGACSEAASALLEMPADAKAAAVISSYAEPLLEGCGSIRKGDLRIVGQSEPVPFITAFASPTLDSPTRQRLLMALVSAGAEPRFLIGMETLAGFVPWKTRALDRTVVKKKSIATP